MPKAIVVLFTMDSIGLEMDVNLNGKQVAMKCRDFGGKPPPMSELIAGLAVFFDDFVSRQSIKSRG